MLRNDILRELEAEELRHIKEIGAIRRSINESYTDGRISYSDYCELIDKCRVKGVVCSNN